jgi:1-acyl-sn-glycerol-3-phosphate acyltransferase
MSKLLALIRTLITYSIVAVVSALCIVPCALIALLPKKYREENRVFFWFATLFYKSIIYASFLPKKYSGLENIPKGPVIFVANHQSSIDIPLVGALCNGYPHVWLVLEYYSTKPILGFFIRRMFVAVDQRNPAKAARSLIRVLQRISDKHSDVIIFPEGGRYEDGKVHKFFQGFALLAKKTGFPVVPIYMPNNGKIYPPYSFIAYYHTIVVIAGKAFIYQKTDTPDLFTQKVNSWFTEQVANFSLQEKLENENNTTSND